MHNIAWTEKELLCQQQLDLTILMTNIVKQVIQSHGETLIYVNVIIAHKHYRTISIAYLTYV